MKIWSELPPKAYSVNINGQQLGLGLLPIWDQVPGAWNILSLIAGPELEALLTWDKEPGDFPTDIGAVPFAVAMALQHASAEITWGELAATTTPAQFLKALREHPQCDKMILPAIFPNELWRRGEEKAATYHNYPDNVVQGHFGGRVH